MSSENESGSPPPLNVEKCSLVLVDVAGTTTSIDFVKDTLFPFVVERVEAFLTAKWEEDSIKESVKQLQEGDEKVDVAKAVEIVKKLTEENSANQGLKTLQGLIYKEGYEKGDLKAHVFGDVAEAFENWAKSRKIAIYSTGSVDSQKLLFAHTTSGDLSGHISKYFDQAVGKKTEAESYKKISEETQVPPEEIVFVTDDAKEATAAKAGGLHAVLVQREGNPDLPADESKDFVVVSSFSELALDKTCKRKVEDDPVDTEAPPSKVPKTNVDATEKVEEESMEVDSQPEKSADAEKTETATEETENLVKNAPEKTDTADKVETTDADMKELESDKTEPETVIVVTVEELLPTVEEPEAEKAVVEEAKEEKPEKVTESEKAAEESKPVEEITVEKVETTSEEQEVAKVEPAAEEPKVEETKTEEKPAEAAKEEKVKDTAEPDPEEAKADVEMAEDKKEEAKAEEKPVLEEETMKNGGEEAETSAPKAEEKENKSVLANGVENGNKDESEVDNATGEKESETAEVTNDDNVDNKDDDTEVKVKKLEESAESKTVSVEV